MQPVRQIAFVLYPGMTALDVIGVYEVLKAIPDVELRFVAHEPGPVLTDSGVLALGATHSFAETPNPDLLLVPGSEADTTTAMADGALLAWLRRAHATSVWTTSVCTGSLVLAAAGILEGHPATTHWAGQSALKRFGATPCPDKRVVRSGKIWTAAGVSAGTDMALALLAEISGQERAETRQLLIEYDPQPPFRSGNALTAPERIMALAKAEVAEWAKNPRNMISVPKILWRRTIAKIRRRSMRAA